MCKVLQRVQQSNIVMLDRFVSYTVNPVMCPFFFDCFEFSIISKRPKGHFIHFSFRLIIHLIGNGSPSKSLSSDSNFHHLTLLSEDCHRKS